MSKIGSGARYPKLLCVGNADILRLNIEVPEGGDNKELALEMTFKS